MLLWNSSCGIFVWTERFFVDLVVAGNFHGFLGLELRLLKSFYCFSFSDRSRSSVKVVVNLLSFD
jgi:hypothetical protein